jgi:hypothetical protein
MKSDTMKLRAILGTFLITAFVVTVAFFELDWIRIESLWFVFPFATIRISTVITAVWGFSLVLFLSKTKIWKSVYYSLLAVIFSMGLYEIVWYYSAAALRGYDLRVFQFAALFGWVLLGIREVFHKRPPRISVVLYGVYAVSMIIWIGTGFQSNDLGNSTFSTSGEVLNIISKFALTTAYSLHIA